MPYTVPVVSRRSFLQHCAAAGAASAIGGCTTTHVAEYPIGPAPASAERWALISDPHISADLRATRGGANMADNLRYVVGEVSSIQQTLAGAVVAGDCARLIGNAGDYASFHNLLTQPLTQSGTPVHLMLGNHDQREHFEAS